METLKRAWRGEASLALAFFVIFLAGDFILYHIIHFFVAQHNPQFTSEYNTILSTGILFPYQLFALVCVWRCAKNSFFLWNIIARIVVISSFIGAVYNLMYV